MSGRAEQDLQREEWIERKLESQPQLIKDFMMSIKRKRTSSTRKAYLGYIIQYAEFMDSQKVKLTDAKPMHIDRFVDYVSEGNGPSIVNAKLNAINGFYKFLLKNGFIKENPCNSDMMLDIKEKDTVVYMTDDEVGKVMGAAYNNKVKYRNRDLCIITLGCATGLRVSAIRNIDIEDIDFDGRTIRVIEKGNVERNITIEDNVIRSIKTWMVDREMIWGSNSGPLFISQKMNRISVRAVERMIVKAAQGVDKHITPHKMRSTCAMMLYMESGDIYLTADQLGHKNLKNTTIYAKATEEKRRMAAKMLDKHLDNNFAEC